MSKKRGSREEIIKVGDVVLMHAENVPRSSWKLAIVKKVLRGSDGLVRVAEIKTNSGVINREKHILSATINMNKRLTMTCTSILL